MTSLRTRLATTLLVAGLSLGSESYAYGEEVSSAAFVGLLEARPAPRLGVGFHHDRFAHTLSFGLGTLGDTEVRTGYLLGEQRVAYPWLAVRIRPIDLPDLPPIEDYLLAGFGFASSHFDRLSLDAGIGLQFQLPPLAAEPAGDLNTYLVENVQVVLRFGVRVRLW